MQEITEHTTPKTIYLKDYCPPDFQIEEVFLEFHLKEEATTVRSRLKLFKKNKNSSADLILDGEELQLLSVRLNDLDLEEGAYKEEPGTLTIYNTPDDIFYLEIETRINPKDNTSLSGLYLSSGNFCTQCEAEGFRKITYFPDRPDVMARYTTKIIADKSLYPVLLSNGNKTDEGQLENNEHWAEFVDPFPKPSYLFALVSGNLTCIEDNFVTLSGKSVALFIYVESHNIDKCDHAMKSLVKSMQWDEQVYGREYDLDTYIIVAVDDFNMGAMENKGLNVFNSKYVLARADTTTDSDYQSIEGVIGHEYFHNWSGNRVTCRDWFQLSLKEGFTVFRDQEFSADMTSRSVKRIEDVNLLRMHQFREDAGPMAHPVRPESYVEINNFYTATVYNKGAEVVRMLHKLLGADGFRKGTDLYFERHDGQAVTTEDFVKALEDANSADLSQFRRWYSQAGTPVVQVRGRYDAKLKQYTLYVKQSCPATPGQEEKLPFHIPLAVGLLDKEGNDMPFVLQGEIKQTTGTSILNIVKAEETILFTEVQSEPVPSILRGFSAPVKLEQETSDDQRLFLMSNDNDGFNRWEAGQQVFIKTILGLVDAIKTNSALIIDESIISAIKVNLMDQNADKSLIAFSLRLPAETYISEFMDVIDPVAVNKARLYFKNIIANSLMHELLEVYDANQEKGDYCIDPESVGQRSLKNTCLGYLMETEDKTVLNNCMDQFYNSSNMTDTISAFSALVNKNCDEREKVIIDFYDKWKHEPLVIDKWFGIQATSRHPDTPARVEKLLDHEDFSLKNPNRIRSLIGAFSQGNQLHFHVANGAGYSLLADNVIRIDATNPQIASRLVTGLSLWKRYDESRQEKMRGQLSKIKSSDGLSKDVYEIVTKSLN